MKKLWNKLVMGITFFFSKSFWRDRVWLPLKKGVRYLFTKQFWKKALTSGGMESFAAALLAILAGLLVGFIIMLITRPSVAWYGFLTMIGRGLFRAGAKGIGYWLYEVGPLLMCGLAVGFAFKTGLFNIGASGQYTVGMFCALVVGIQGDFFGPFQWVAAVIAGMIGGAIWGFLPGFFKAYFNVNEVITAIMFNYIGMYSVNWIIKSSDILYNSSQALTRRVDQNAYNPILWLRNWFPDSPVDIGFLLAIVIAIVIFIILNKTTFGYELKACGFNRNASKYGGINEKRSIIAAMAISGGLAGIGGALFILGPGIISGTGFVGTYYEPTDLLLANGFNGISVALLGMSNPIGIIASTLFVTFIQRGGYYMQTYLFKEELIDIIVAVIIYFSAAALFVRQFVKKRLLKAKEKRNALAELDATPPPDVPLKSDVAQKESDR